MQPIFLPYKFCPLRSITESKLLEFEDNKDKAK